MLHPAHVPSCAHVVMLSVRFSRRSAHSSPLRPRKPSRPAFRLRLQRPAGSFTQRQRIAALRLRGTSHVARPDRPAAGPVGAGAQHPVHAHRSDRLERRQPPLWPAELRLPRVLPHADERRIRRAPAVAEFCSDPRTRPPRDQHLSRRTNPPAHHLPDSPRRRARRPAAGARERPLPHGPVGQRVPGHLARPAAFSFRAPPPPAPSRPWSTRRRAAKPRRTA